MPRPGYFERVGEFTLWRPPVPYVPPDLINSAAFLYPSEGDARRGTKWGGSGFLVGVRSGPYHAHLYVVSNDHVVHTSPAV